MKSRADRWSAPRIVLAVAATAAAGVLFIYWEAGRADREMRGNLRQLGRMAAQAVSIQQIKALAGTETDLRSPDYRRLKEQLMFMRRAYAKCRFLYLLGRRGAGRIFFYLDSEPASSRDYSPPGQAYEEASPRLLRVFETKAGDVEGPVSDSWGTWVSALEPLTDPDTGQLVAVLGMDVDARTWKRETASRAALPAFLMLGLLALLAVGAAASRSRARLRESETKFAAVASSALDAIIMMDPDGNISLWNEASERVFGYSPPEALGKNLHALLAPQRFHESHAACLPHFQRTGEGAAVGKTIELVGLRKDGREFPLDLSLSAVTLQGRWFAVGIVRDISERKRTEEAARRTNKTLSAMVSRLEDLGAQSKELRELGGFLLSCSTLADIHPVVMRAMEKLFPASAGSLFLLSPSRTDLESVVCWGDFPKDADDNVFAPDACWGLIRGGLYQLDDLRGGLVCRHVRHGLPAAFVCQPLMAKSEVLGLLHIRKPQSAGPEETRRWLAGLRGVTSELSELLSLSVSNIRLREKLRMQSIRDPLTGLFNRRYMEESFQKEIMRAARRQEPIGVIMLDIDHFKSFNDLHGHAAGDAVLIALANFFKARLRGADSACRIGGEEFVFILPESSLENSAKRAGEMAEELKALRIPHGGESLGPVTVSMGIAAYPLHGARPDDLLRAADAALYRAKQEGRNRVVRA